LYLLVSYTAPTYIYTLSLHDALPIFQLLTRSKSAPRRARADASAAGREITYRGRPQVSSSFSMSLPMISVTSVSSSSVSSMKAEIGRHTSELQSRVDLVCRLLLEKKK